MIRTALAVVALLGPWITNASERASETAIKPSIDASALLSRIDALRVDANIPGLSVAVVQDRTILLAAGLGFADAENRIPAAADTPFDIASVTKPIAGVVALRLTERGVLDLDRPIAEYSDWTDFCNRFSNQSSIFARDLQCEPSNHTLRNLLSHTATGAAGTRFSYNPVVFSWASRPMMSATGVRFSDLVDQYVFEPAGMKQSARKYRDLPLRADLAQRIAIPHTTSASGVATRSPPLAPQGDGAAGGVVSTVLDLARFDIALDEGKLLSTASRSEMMTPTPIRAGAAAAPYGIGFYVQEYNDLTLVWHAGWWEDAYSALYLKVPELDVTLILLANSEGIWWGNPLNEATVEDSPFARAFLDAVSAR